LLIADEHNVDQTPAPFDFHHILQDASKSFATVALVERNRAQEPSTKPIDPTNARTSFDGVSFDLHKYVTEWIAAVASEDVNTFPSQTLPSGAYERNVNAERTFDSQALIVNGKDICSLKLELKYTVQVIRSPIVSHFEVETRGKKHLFCAGRHRHWHISDGIHFSCWRRRGNPSPHTIG
jgi:hypothetical protein